MQKSFKRSTSVQFASVVFKPENLSILAARNLAMNSPRLVVLAPMLLFSVLMAATSEVNAYFFKRHPLYCGPVTLAEQIADADAALLVRLVETKAPEEAFRGSTTLSIIEVTRGWKGKFKQGDNLTLPYSLKGMPGDLFLWTGSTDETGTEISWDRSQKVTDASYRYITQAPSPEKPKALRLEYFLKFLEAADALISNDANDEFGDVAHDDIVKIKDKLDRATIRQWITDTKTPPLRLTLYGQLLGLCGNADDAEMLRARIGEDAREFRCGLDGLISGYLLLTGAEGLEFIDEKKLRVKGAPFSETYAAMQALRFMWSHGNGRISEDRLRQSMRELLAEPSFADLVISDLARWKDWSAQVRLLKLYGTGEYDTPPIRRAIVRYLFLMEQDQPPDSAAARETRMKIEKLRVQDPTTVKHVEKFLIVPVR